MNMKVLVTIFALLAVATVVVYWPSKSEVFAYKSLTIEKAKGLSDHELMGAVITDLVIRFINPQGLDATLSLVPEPQRTVLTAYLGESQILVEGFLSYQLENRYFPGVKPALSDIQAAYVAINAPSMAEILGRVQTLATGAGARVISAYNEIERSGPPPADLPADVFAAIDKEFRSKAKGNGGQKPLLVYVKANLVELLTPENAR